MSRPVDWLPSILSEPLFWVHQNQTLVAGVLATAAAAWTVKFLSKQIDQSEAHRRQDHERRHRMLRAGLPTALSEVSDYAEKCAQFVWRIRHDQHPANLTQITPPFDAMRSIQAVIETAEEPSVNAIENLIRFFQIHESRFRTFTKRSEPSKENTANSILDSLFLVASCSRLFSYARGVASEPSKWRDSNWAKNQVPEVALGPNSGSLPVDEELEQRILAEWNSLIERYGGSSEVFGQAELPN